MIAKYTRLTTIPAIELRSSTYLTITEEDWSDVRSPGRARRRRRQGHAQRIRFVTLPDPKLYQLQGGIMIGHPKTIERMERELAARMAERHRDLHETMFLTAYAGRPLT